MLVLLLATIATTAAADPLAAAAAERRIANVEAGIPPQCYTKTGGASNPCWVCHTTANGRNRSNDWALQQRYDFSDLGRANHWTNLFKDRRAEIATIDDQWMLAHIRQDNYSELRKTLAALTDYPAWRPDFDAAQGFDEAGFARDHSGWRAFRYKPFPGTFWPTNGSTDDVAIRLPAMFRSDANGQPSRAVYQANLAIVEATVAIADSVADQKIALPIEPIDERAAGIDLNGDGRIDGIAHQLRGLPAHYAGAAAEIAVRRYEYPAGTEFLHGVHYVDPDAPEMRATRFKELRYALKRGELSDAALQRRYNEEAQEQLIGGRPHYSGSAFTGQTNAFGWQFTGYIEDASGQLRLQTREEQLYCMGCHTGLGVTVDQTFSLPRKPPGARGWGEQRIAGMADAPEAGSREPEYLRYLKRVGAGDEFRANTEMLTRFFRRAMPPQIQVADDSGIGKLDSNSRNSPQHLNLGAVQKSEASNGIAGLIEPSRERALALDKAYTLVVREQSYTLGRDAVIEPMQNVLRTIDPPQNGEAAPAVAKVFKDGRLWLDWDSTNMPK